jgi:4-amino-4-deoxy-L-arabinose transferase-like glycosyltransferase
VSQPPLILYMFAASGRLVGSYEVGAVLVSVVLGMGTVVVAYALGLRLHGRLAGGAAAVFVAVLPLHISLSRKAFLDVGLTFFLSLAVLFFLIWHEKRTSGWAFATGLAAAAAALSKLPGVLIFPILVAGLVPVVAGVWRSLRRSDKGSSDHADARWEAVRLARHLGWAALPPAVLGGLYLAHLAYLRAIGDLWDKLFWNAERVSGTGESSGLGREPWHFYLADADSGLLAQLGLGITALSLFGIVLLGRSRRVKESIALAPRAALIAWPVVLILFFSLSVRKQWFYIAPAAVPLAVLAAFAVAWLVGYVRRRLPDAGEAGAGPWRAGAILTAAGVVLVALAPPALGATEDYVIRQERYGSGVKEAALWIQDEDPDAAQIGTMLGRFTLHFYNGQTTYHYFVDHDYVNASIERGQVRYVVIDDYLDFPRGEVWLQGIVDTYDGQPVAEFGHNEKGEARVVVYALNP